MRKKYTALHDLDPVMKYLGFEVIMDPIPHISHSTENVKLPLRDTITIKSKQEQYQENYELLTERKYPSLNRQAYVANRIDIRLKNFSEHFPDNALAWQEVNINIAKHGALVFSGVFIPLVQGKIKNGTYKNRQINLNLPMSYRTYGVMLVPKEPYETGPFLDIHFDYSPKNVRVHYEQPNEAEPHYWVSEMMIQELEKQGNITHSREAEGIFDNDIEVWSEEEEQELDALGLREFLATGHKTNNNS
jgi:hypothetical protein